ncbi:MULTISPECIES: sensor histidine kinase [unclassified Saccharothrix]|uniref:sensor histidine kinase n=1 Tax=unclassified Saccharothrix TaxID=2593673 RepID=UPI00307D5078
MIDRLRARAAQVTRPPRGPVAGRPRPLPGRVLAWAEADPDGGQRGPVRLRAGVAALARATGPLPRPGRRSLVFDVLLAVALCVGALDFALNITDFDAPVGLFPPDPMAPPPPFSPFAEPRSAYEGSEFGAVVVALVASLALVARRRYPLAVLWVVMLVGLTVPDAPRLTFYACVIAAYTAAAYSPYRVATLASLPLAVLALWLPEHPVLPTVPNEYVPLLVVVPLVLAANGLRTWKLRADERRTRLSVMEREQRDALRRAVEQERARIARELHDVVTHNVSVMVIQTGAARKVMGSAPDQARDALLAVEAAGRSAMAELRHVMGLLTPDGPDADDLAPQPGIDRLDDLVGRMRGAGLPVGLTVAGPPRPVPSGVGLAAYRVVQEALTNTVKHASGASATVTVEYTPDHLSVEVADTGGVATGAAGSGRGLIGLRERLSVYGGTLHTGPRPTGGYRVKALIPLEGM